jgi:predicted dehydrogenase
VAARNRKRAEAFAAEHDVERVAGSYAEILADPEVEVVYNPLPNALHGPWNLAAIEAGKHLLSEKPFASTAEEAAEIMDFVQPHTDDRLLVRTGTDARTEHMGTRSSYIYQLEEFITALRGGWRMPTDPDDAVATAQLIDQCYRAADLPLRPRKPSPQPDIERRR